MSVSTSRPAYKRVLLKISGESFCREGESGISMAELSSVAEQIRDVMQGGVQLAIVCGGGNSLQISVSRLSPQPHITWECWRP